jgi:Tfp pilus assembly protein PilN
MRSISIDVDIDIYDIIHSLYSKAAQIEMLEALLDAMDTKVVLETLRSHSNYEGNSQNVNAAMTGDDLTFKIACAKIDANRWRLNLEDEQYILNLADKL